MREDRMQKDKDERKVNEKKELNFEILEKRK